MRESERENKIVKVEEGGRVIGKKDRHVERKQRQKEVDFVFVSLVFRLFASIIHAKQKSKKRIRKGKGKEESSK